MIIYESLAIALSLSVDAFVCSVIYGNHPYKLSKKFIYAFTMAFCFGFFQFLMPVIGYFAGNFVSGYLEQYDHWCAFILLALVSGNMVKEAFEKSEDTKEKTLNLFVLFSLSIATSIDALALGFSVSVLNQSILLLSIIIGVVCFITSAIGFFVGQILAKLKGFERALNLLGAITLMTIALAILVEHQAFYSFA